MKHPVLNTRNVQGREFYLNNSYICWLNIIIDVEFGNHWRRGISPFIHSFTSAVDISDWPHSGPGRITNVGPALEFLVKKKNSSWNPGS